ncbi:signal-transduction protein with cAMP-binding, CBS, and nucleotidyltransferase domain [Paenibacillus forsythiae]|uniref:Signal-transduction protein with cAMP-binding, CBS, and nucleotidyltransferase domain n=1 Tax=Paenibacillus forsythiae TaxID=365616 RepID=A0ABU3HB19_9BACL|nr:hypothetical protein [Paenibacillus forsythiae]MDT3427971.1 signal-transduction protein with cAMP-binding, CBS, and nucleotidyltransferase domain [Paenibacillus forsythiae]
MTTTATSAALKLADLMRPAPVVYDHRTCRQALRLMFEHPESKCLVLCNAADEPVGLLMSENFLLQATGRFGMDTFYREPAMKLAHNNPLIVDIAADPHAVLATAMDRHPKQQNDCIIVTDHGKLAGVVYVSDLHALRP